MQVPMDDGEYREIQRFAREKKMTVAEWVRQALRAARQQEPRARSEKRFDVVREAAGHSFPTGDIGQILSEIEQGYLDDSHS